MTKYENSIIYKLCCKDPSIEDIYIGSTINLYRRKHAHKTHCNNESHKEYKFNVYITIRNNGGWSNWDMIEIERVNCKDKLELNKIEREWIDKLKPTLNQRSPHINKTKSQKNKEYNEKHKWFCNICNKYYAPTQKKVHKNSMKHKYTKLSRGGSDTSDTDSDN